MPRLTTRQSETVQLSTISTKQSSRRRACDRCVQGKRRCDARGPCGRCYTRGLKCSLEADDASDTTAVDTKTASENYNKRSSNTAGYLDLIDKYYECADISDSIDLDWVELHRDTSDIYRIFTNPSPILTVQLSPLRLQNCIRRLQKCVTDMAQEVHSAFVRVIPIYGVEQYDNPLDDAFFACTAYHNKSRHTHGFLTQTLSRSFLKLIRRLRTCLSFEEHLFNLQAILLFQIIFFLGDDDSLSELARAQIEIVESSIQIFQGRLIEQICSSATTSNSTFTSSPYHQWLVLENARRTVLAHLFIKAIDRHLRNGCCDQVPYMAPLPLTIEGELWDAQSEEEWWQIVHAKKAPLELSVKSYSEAIDTWTMNDYQNMDDFQILLLGACKETPPGR